MTHHALRLAVLAVAATTAAATCGPALPVAAAVASDTVVLAAEDGPEDTTTDPPPGIEVGPVFPIPAPPPPDGGQVDGGGSGGGLFDFLNPASWVRSAINDWFRDVAMSALAPVLDLLGRTLLATPSVAGMARVRDLWGVSAGLANALLVLFVLAGSAIAMSYETVQTRYTAKEIAPRLVIGAIAANASLGLASTAVVTANALSLALLGESATQAGATGAMRDLVLAPLEGGGIFLILVGLVVAVFGLVLVAVFVIRIALVILLVVAAPLMLVTHALPQTEGLAWLWWRGMAALLGVQVGQALILSVAVHVFFAGDGRAALGVGVGGALVDLCLLWVLIRLPVWAARLALSNRRSRGLRAVTFYVATRVARAAA